MRKSICCLFVMGCKRVPFRDPPIHPIQDMLNQSVLKSQSVDPFYADCSSDREPVPGTIFLQQNLSLSMSKKTKSGRTKMNSSHTFPIDIRSKTELFLEQKQYNIYCSPCHIITGKWDGLVTKHSKGTILPPSLHKERLIKMSAGQIYRAIK